MQFTTMKNKMRSCSSSVTDFFPHLAEFQLKCLSDLARSALWFGSLYDLSGILDLRKCCLKSFKGNDNLKTSVANGLSRKKTP